MYDPRFNKYYLNEEEANAIQHALYNLDPTTAADLTAEFVGKLDAALRNALGLTNIPISESDVIPAIEEAEAIVRGH